jgi:hypothetical protein
MEEIVIFAHHLHDTIILLGGRRDIADMLLCIDLLDGSAIDGLRQYNISLHESLKDRMVALNTSTVTVERTV